MPDAYETCFTLSFIVYHVQVFGGWSFWCFFFRFEKGRGLIVISGEQYYNMKNVVRFQFHFNRKRATATHLPGSNYSCEMCV